MCSHRGHWSGVRAFLQQLSSVDSNPIQTGKHLDSGSFPYLIMPRVLLHSSSKKVRVMVLNATVITLSLWLISTAAEPQGQQITHIIKLKTLSARQSLKYHKTSASATAPATEVVEVPKPTWCPCRSLLMDVCSTSSSHMVQISSLNPALWI